MDQNLPGPERRCSTYSWCSTVHDDAGAVHTKNIDLVEHLDDADCLVEVNVSAHHGGQPVVQALLTDLDGEEHNIELTPEQAWTIGHIVHLFDRRGLREFGHMLKEATETINAASSS